MKNWKLLQARLAQAAAATGLVVAATSSHAAIDLSEVTPVFTDGGVAAATLGGLGLAMVVGIRIFKKIRGAV